MTIKRTRNDASPASRTLSRGLLACLILTGLALSAAPAPALVELLDPSYTLRLIADSGAPVHPSQPDMDRLCAFGDEGTIESIGIDPATRTLYIQIINSSVSTRTCIFSIDALTGATALVNPDTGLQIIDRGADMIYDPATGLLLTADSAFNAQRIASIDPATGTVGTYAQVGIELQTLGMQFSEGAGGSVVPAGRLMYTTDEADQGIYDIVQGATTSTLHVIPPGAGDDMMIQPDGDWVHVGDFNRYVRAYSPVAPHPNTATSTVDMWTMFMNEALLFDCGTRATMDAVTGEPYISFSCSFGGTGIFRMDEDLQAQDLVVKIRDIAAFDAEGLQDMIYGPSSNRAGRSIYFTVHDWGHDTEEVWELQIPSEGPPVCDADGPYTAECQGPQTRIRLDGTGSSSSDGSPLTYLWTTDCPNGSFDNDASPTPWLTLDSDAATLPLTCNVDLIVTDVQGQTGSCSSTVTVDDTLAPSILCDPAVTLQTGPNDDDCLVLNTLPDPPATDGCDSSPVVTSNGPAFFPLGLTTVTWTATDAAGNSASCTQDVTVEDDTPPRMTCPGPITLYTGPDDDDCLVPNTLPDPPATDNCDPDPAVTSDGPAFFPLGLTVVTYTATDDAGNTTTCTRDVTVEDNTPPKMTCFGPITLYTGPDDDDCLVPNTLPDPPATDNCDPDPAVTSDGPAFFPLGLTAVTYTATDDAGNTATCTREVTVEDNTPPVIDCPGPITLYTGPDDDDCLVPNDLPLPPVTDNCDPDPDIVSDGPAFFPLGDTTVTYTATDESGNTSSCSHVVTTSRATPPAAAMWSPSSTTHLR